MSTKLGLYVIRYILKEGNRETRDKGLLESQYTVHMVSRTPEECDRTLYQMYGERNVSILQSYRLKDIHTISQETLIDIVSSNYDNETKRRKRLHEEWEIGLKNLNKSRWGV